MSRTKILFWCIILTAFISPSFVQAEGCAYFKEGLNECSEIDEVGSCGSNTNQLCAQGTGNTNCRIVKTCVSYTKLVNPIGGTESDKQGVIDIQTFIGTVIQQSLGVVGAVTLLVFVYGGFVWLTSAGSEEKVRKGSAAMLYAGIGLTIIFASYTVLNLILNGLHG